LSLLRIVAGFMFMTAGTTKVFAFPQGMPHNGGTAEFMSQMWIGGWLEAVGGALLMLGWYTRPVAFVVAGMMAVAYFQFHVPKNYLWPTLNGGMSAALFSLIWLYFSAAGPGPLSLDATLRRR
jgi:putative oxidoreductase